jgi:hypothetical protein
MGTTLTGLTPATTYDALIKVGDNGPITSALKVLSDGLGTNLPMEASTTGVNFTGTLQQSGVAVPTQANLATKQDTLVSGTNIKTINSTSILGSGNITVVTSPSGVSGAIQFSNGSAFASDATNLFWDDTNNRLGVGLNNPTATTQIKGASTGSGTNSFIVQDSAGTNLISVRDDGILSLFTSSKTGQLDIQGGANSGIYSKAYSSQSDNIIRYKDYNGNQAMMLTMTGSGSGSLTVNNGITSLGATIGIKGSGATSATTSLLVQNSAGTNIFKIGDSARIDVLGTIGSIDFSSYYQIFSSGNASTVGCWKGSQAFSVDGSRLCVNVATSAHSASASFQVDSTTTGILPPRMTTTQKNAIASPAAGLVLYDSTTNKLQCYNGSTWNDLF